MSGNWLNLPVSDKGLGITLALHILNKYPWRNSTNADFVNSCFLNYEQCLYMLEICDFPTTDIMQRNHYQKSP